MKRFIQGEHRGQGTLLPASLDDYVSDTNPVRVVDVFVDELDLVNLGFLHTLGRLLPLTDSSITGQNHAPIIKSRFCTAAPAAPFPRLSNTAANRTCPVSSFSNTTNCKLSVPLSA